MLLVLFSFFLMWSVYYIVLMRIILILSLIRNIHNPLNPLLDLYLNPSKGKMSIIGFENTGNRLLIGA